MCITASTEKRKHPTTITPSGMELLRSPESEEDHSFLFIRHSPLPVADVERSGYCLPAFGFAQARMNSPIFFFIFFSFFF
jgi:hypothetical protein